MATDPGDEVFRAFHLHQYWDRLRERIARTPNCLVAYVLGNNDKWTMECVIADIQRTTNVQRGDILKMSDIWRQRGPVIFTVTRAG